VEHTDAYGRFVSQFGDSDSVIEPVRAVIRRKKKENALGSNPLKGGGMLQAGPVSMAGLCPAGHVISCCG